MSLALATDTTAASRPGGRAPLPTRALSVVGKIHVGHSMIDTTGMEGLVDWSSTADQIVSSRVAIGDGAV